MSTPADQLLAVRIGPTSAAGTDADRRALARLLGLPASSVEVVPAGDGERLDLRALRRSMDRSLAVVVLGDALRGDRRVGAARAPEATAALVAVARLARRPVALVGVRASALDRGARGARLAVHQADLALLADEQAAAAALAAGIAPPVRLGPDPAWALLDEGWPTGDGDGPLLVPVDKRLLEVLGARRVVTTLTPLAARGVRLLPRRPVDERVAVAMAAVTGAAVAPVATTVDELAVEVSGAGVVVTSDERLLALAAATRTPAVWVGSTSGGAHAAASVPPLALDRLPAALHVARAIGPLPRARARAMRAAAAEVGKLLQLLANGGHYAEDPSALGALPLVPAAVRPVGAGQLGPAAGPGGRS